MSRSPLCPTPIPSPCDCEDILCRLDALESNVSNIFNRTTDIHGYMKKFFITNEEELQTALLRGGRWFVLGEISLTEMADAVTDDTFLYSFPDEDGNKATITYPYSVGVSRSVIKISARNVHLVGLKITTGHPLTPAGLATQDKAVEINYNAGVDTSGFNIDSCDLSDVCWGVYRLDNLSSDESYGGKVIDCNIHSFARGGIFLGANCKKVNVSFNRIHGRDDGETHRVIWNAIDVRNNANFAYIGHNEIAKVGRHGIEYWNSQTDPETVGGNESARIEHNVFDDPILGADGANIGCFAISAFGYEDLHICHNTVKGGWSIGYELYNDLVNTGRVLCYDNYGDGCTGQAISVNATKGCRVFRNILKNCSNLGIQIINGAEDLTISDNETEAAGSIAILLNGQAMNITAVTPGVTTVFTVSQTIAAPGVAGSEAWYTGKKVYIRSLTGGDASYDALIGYHTFTRLSDHTFSVPVDSSAYAGTVPTAGYVEQAFNRISITNNKITIPEILAGPYNPQNHGFLGFFFQSAVYKNNEVWAKEDVVSLVLPARMYHFGTVYSGVSAEAPLELATPGGFMDIEESNLLIPYTD